MPNYLRPKVTGGCVFFTVALEDRRSDLLTREIDALRMAFRKTLRERPCTLDALVILPDHLHAVMTFPAGDADYPTRWRLIKTRFSMCFPPQRSRPSHHARAERGIWQRRYWEHHIRNDADYAIHVQYCWFNPVKHGLVDSPAAWPFSTFHRDVERGRVPQEWVAREMAGEFGE